MTAVWPARSCWHTWTTGDGRICGEVSQAQRAVAGHPNRAAELRRAVEVAALEQKLLDTKRRHAQELAQLMEASDVLAGTAPAMSQGVSGPQSGAARDESVMAVQQRMVATGISGDVRAMRLWVEDHAGTRSCRLHAMDEVSGLHAHIDVPDSTLSAMLAGFRQGQAARSTNEEGHDLDSCLQVLLDAAYVCGPTASGCLEVRLPSVASLTAAAAMVVASEPTPNSRATPSRVVGCNAPRQPHVPRATPVPAMSSAVSAAHARQLASCMVEGDVPSQRAADFFVPSAAAWCGMDTPPTLAQVSAADCSGHAPLATPSACPSKPPHQRRMPVRPPSARRPQSAGHAGREMSPLSATAPLTGQASEQSTAAYASVLRRRRVRPTSAKALKHRRVVDDGADPIIYEDLEEELEAAEPAEAYERFQAYERQQRSFSCPRQLAGVVYRTVRPNVPRAGGRVPAARPSSAGARSRGSNNSSGSGAARREASLLSHEEVSEDVPGGALSTAADATSSTRLTPRPPTERPTPGRPCRGRQQAQQSHWDCSRGCEKSQPHADTGSSSMGSVPSTAVPMLGAGPRASSPPSPPRFSQADAARREVIAESSLT